MEQNYLFFGKDFYSPLMSHCQCGFRSPRFNGQGLMMYHFCELQPAIVPVIAVEQIDQTYLWCQQSFYHLLY